MKDLKPCDLCGKDVFSQDGYWYGATSNHVVCSATDGVVVLHTHTPSDEATTDVEATPEVEAPAPDAGFVVDTSGVVTIVEPSGDSVLEPVSEVVLEEQAKASKAK